MNSIALLEQKACIGNVLLRLRITAYAVFCFLQLFLHNRRLPLWPHSGITSECRSSLALEFNANVLNENKIWQICGVVNTFSMKDLVDISANGRGSLY